MRLTFTCLLSLVLLASCSFASTQPAATLPAAASPAATKPPAALESPTAQLTQQPVSSPTVLPALTFKNPVLRANFPDPFILRVGDTFYAYATNGQGGNVQMSTSADLVHWAIPVDAMSALASWVNINSSDVWAPEVMPVGDKYLLYYTARDKTSGKQCVGVAVSDKPEGKFKDASSKPLVCQVDLGGTIDPDPFRDEDGKLYLYFKNDGNCCGIATVIFAQPLSEDGLSVQGVPIDLIRNDQPWEGNVIEAPTMFKHDGKYYLFFSANNYAGIEYSVGYADCDSPSGPCQDAPENPILKSDLSNKDAMVIGPGHQALLQLGSQTWIFYHAWEEAAGRRGERRFMWMDKLDWVDGKPVVRGPTITAQPVPVIP